MNIFKGILDQQKKFDVNIDEEDKVLLLLIWFIDSFNNFMEMILCGKDTITHE